MFSKKLWCKSLFLIVLFSLFLSAYGTPSIAHEGRYSMTYLYLGNTALYKSYVDRTNNSLNSVSPDYFEIDSQGNLKLNSILDSAFVTEMHKRGIKVSPFLSNHWNRENGRAALENRSILAGQIADAIKKYNFDGVNIDIENLTETDRDHYTDFVKQLRGLLPSDKEITVAVAANPKGNTTGWAASYDYKALGELSNYIMLMAYDESYFGSPQGPVASAQFVEESIKYALKYVPKEKLILGLPFYGRYWKVGKSTGGHGIAAYDVENLIQKYNGIQSYDEYSQTAKAYITIKPGEETSNLWGYQKLDSGSYVIYYDNERALKYKLSLALKYDLKGTGSWCLGQESLSTWKYYSTWLGGKYFADIADSWAAEDILAVVKKGLMKGTSDGYFTPGGILTRAEAAVILVRALGLENTQSGADFFDTVDHWARKEISIARKHKIVYGQGENLFSPNRPVTRQEMAVLLDRVLVLPDASETAAKMFTDINQRDNGWSYASILKLAANGILKGKTDGSFRPADSMNRAEIAAVMNRSSAYPMYNRFNLESDNGTVAVTR